MMITLLSCPDTPMVKIVLCTGDPGAQWNANALRRPMTHHDLIATGTERHGAQNGTLYVLCNQNTGLQIACNTWEVPTLRNSGRSH